MIAILPVKTLQRTNSVQYHIHALIYDLDGVPKNPRASEIKHMDT